MLLCGMEALGSGESYTGFNGFSNGYPHLCKHITHRGLPWQATVFKASTRANSLFSRRPIGKLIGRKTTESRIVYGSLPKTPAQPSEVATGC